ncbi:MAG: LytTR family transcriptional regulator DNA-binding domain-containing protein [Bacteroidales bacterium]|nr:LytTR family transcriptional regulator DNA-binding domain-containing protein [Bacteroidales bacterium]
MNKIKTIIIEDEELSRELIKNFLKDLEDIEIIKECENGFEGIKAINELDPDLVFLDIQMPKLNGFEMLELVDQSPEIIFITAHNDYAIRAFEMNAVDYLLKPYSKDRLISAVSRVRQRIAAGHDKSHPEPDRDDTINRLIRQPLGDNLNRIVVKSGTRIRVIPVDRIIYLEAQDDYVMIYTDEGKHLKKGTMNHFEEHLDADSFVRVHRSYIVKIDQVSMIEPYSRDNYIMKLKNGAQIRVSRKGLKNIREKFNF